MTTEKGPVQQQETEALTRVAGVECFCATCAAKQPGYCSDYCLACEIKRVSPCQGTGRKYPGLSRECKTGYDLDDGSGRVPVSAAEALYWLMGQEGYRFCSRHQFNGKPHYAVNSCGGEVLRYGDSPLLALLAAVETSDASD